MLSKLKSIFQITFQKERAVIVSSLANETKLNLKTNIKTKLAPRPIVPVPIIHQQEDNDQSIKYSRPTIRWGIAPVSRVAYDFAQALSVLPMNQHRLVACTSSYRSQADTFAKRFNVTNVFTSFEEFAKCDDIDVVYISPLTPMHSELGHMMLQNGKHVVCETPFCMNEYQATKLIGESQRRQCFLMEGQWSRFLPTYKYIRELIKNDKIGDVSDIKIHYGMPISDLERMTKRYLGGGVALELGPSAIQLALWIFRMQPFNITATGILNEDGVDTAATINLDFSCGRRAVINLNSEYSFQNSARIKGTKGTLTIPDFYCPSKIISHEGIVKNFNLPEDSSLHSTNFPKRLAMTYQAEEVRKCINDKKIQSPLLTHKETLVIQRICDEVRRQLGVVYPEDKYNVIPPQKGQLVGHAFENHVAV